jgi:hypothetical protein
MSAEAFEFVRTHLKWLDPSASNQRGALHKSTIDFGELDRSAATSEQAIAIVEGALIDDASWDLAKAILFVQLKAGIPLHPLLSQLAATMLISKEKKKNRRPKLTGRDQVIVAMLMLLERKFNIAPTRNRTSSNLSGADIVSTCLNERKFNMTPEAVAKVWTNRRKE